jgi:HD-GYP domain-containing protein (c-di-GMP phosphodiesterase class II)
VTGNEEEIAYLRRSSLLESHVGFKLETILQHILKARDSYTQGHCCRVVTLAEAIGLQFKLNDHQMDVLSLAAGFHDIGKIGIPDQILLKSGELSEEEYEGIKQHPIIGATMLRSIGNPMMDEVAECVLHHHEHWDGQGYPQGLAGEDIPLLSRIVSVVDAYDAMTTTRSYRKSIDKATAIRMIESLSGKQFDPAAVESLIEISEDKDSPCNL